MYGYQDSNELGPGKAGGKFGLNSGVFITKFEYNGNAGKDNGPGDAIDLTVQIKEKEYRRRFYPVNKVYGKEGGELADNTTDEYKEAMKKEVALLNATLSHIVTCFVEESLVKEALSTPIANFKDYAEILERLVKSTPNWNKMPVDVFLHYQWSISGENDRTYLELPKNVRHGVFVVKSHGNGYSPTTEGSLNYINAEGQTHPFKRSEWYAESAFSNQTILEEPTSNMGATQQGTPAEGW